MMMIGASIKSTIQLYLFTKSFFSSFPNKKQNIDIDIIDITFSEI